MALRSYEQRWVPQLQSALGEPILRCVALNVAGVHTLMWTDSILPFWRQYLLVNGQPYMRVPRTMFLILTPTRVMITQTRKTFIHGFAPELAAPILVLLRGDAEITAAQDPMGAFAYRLRSRASGAELELELAAYGGIAAELAWQLREFAGTPSTATVAPGTATVAPSTAAETPSAAFATATPSTPSATSEISPSRRRVVKTYQLSTNLAVIAGVLLIVVTLGMGAFSFYQYQAGTPTKATIVSCSGAKRRHCDATWSIDGQSYTGSIAGRADNSYQVGSSRDVRVRNGTAYTAASVNAWFWRALYIAGLVVVAILVRAWIKRRFVGKS